ncbi:MAG: hypothetical protein COY42_34130 [Armatimonadetes bacterium CG_4_10_14_0_8_um_filter_66_14]|nr:MAG: hypothetical protein COY42_34130 [Armatimonadetes bacterium CG_4_10_14_0_8_um_filter_66_14]
MSDNTPNAYALPAVVLGVVAAAVGWVSLGSVSAGELLYEDHFNAAGTTAPAPPWKVLEGAATIENGRLHIVSDHANPRVLLDRVFEGDISVAMRLMQAPRCHWSGMVVKDAYWLSVNQQYSSLMLDRRIQHVPSGVAAEDVGKQLGRAPSWQKYLWDPDSFVLRLDCVGQTVRAYLDGKLFLDVQDELMPESGKLMLVGGWGTDVYVDGVTVRRFSDDLLPPKPVPVVSPTLANLKTTLDRQDAIYFDGESAQLTTEWLAQEATPLRLRFNLTDVYGQPAGSVEARTTQETGRTENVTVALSAPRRGLFKVALTAIPAAGPETPQGDLISFSVLPKRLSEQTADEASYFGGHPHWELPEFHYPLARKLGMRWARDHDAIQYTWWTNVQPERGKWRWYDDDIALLRSNGLNLLGEFMWAPEWAATTAPGVAAHARSRQLPQNMDDFRRYVFETVSHYRDSLKYWEVWNEPHYSGFWVGTPEQYVELLSVAYEAAKQANPDCVIVGGGGFALSSLDWVDKALRAGMLKYCDVVSFHYGYAGQPFEKQVEWFTQHLSTLRAMMRDSGGEKPLWNTEAAVYSTSFLDQNRAGYAENDAVYNYREAADAVVRMYVVNLAAGVRKMFYYDALWPRRKGFVESFLSDPVNTRMLELHGGLKPLGVAYATAADLLDGATFVEAIAQAAGIRVYVFQGAGRCVAVCWRNSDRDATEVPLRLPAVGDWERSDVMNVRTPVAASPTLRRMIGRAPTFYIAQGVTVDQFSTAWHRADVRE